MSSTRKNPWNDPKHHERMRLAHLGHKHTDEQKKKISEALKGRKLRPAHAKAIKKALTPKIIKQRTENIKAAWTEQRRIEFGEQMRKRWAQLSKETRKKHAEKSSKGMKDVWQKRSIVEREKLLDVLAKNHRPTETEKKVASYLKRRGIVFVQQHRFGNAVADIYIPKLKLVIECDGSYHRRGVNQRQNEKLEKHGLHVLRLRDEDLLKSVTKTINKEIKQNLFFLFPRWKKL